MPNARLSRRVVAWLLLLTGLCGIVLLLGPAWPVAPAAAEPLAQSPTQPPSARQGHALYQENCAPCHGAEGWGDGPTAASLPEGATALADPEIARRATPAEWFEVTKEGRMASMMPPWQNRLSDEEIWDVVTFAFTLHTSQEEILRGEQVWGEHCAACHGQEGKGDGTQALAAGLAMPDLSDPSLGINRSLEDWFAVTSAGQGDMPAFADALSEEERWAVVNFARTFSHEPVLALTVPTGEGRLVGTVTNETPAGGDVVGLTVTLRSFRDFEELPPREAQVGPDGRYAFEGLPTDQSFVYLVTTEYGDIPFASEMARFEEGVTEVTAPVSVWETSTEPGSIEVNLAQWFVEYHQGALLVGELYRITHDSDRVYIGDEEVAPGRPAVLRFELPAGAEALRLEGGEIGDRYVLTRDGVVDTQPLPPGQVQVLMRYLLPYSGTRAELAHSVAYPVRQFSALVAEGPTVSSSQLSEMGIRQVDERDFSSWEATDLAAGQEVSLRLRDLERSNGAMVEPARGTNSSTVLAYHPTLVYGLGLLAAVLVVGLVAVPLIRSSRRLQQPKAANSVEAGVEVERQRLLEVIAALDDRYAAGELDEADYLAARAAYKRRLLQISRAAEAGAAASGPSAAADGAPIDEAQEP